MAAAEVPLDGGGSTRVVRVGEVVLRERRAWSDTVVRLLGHLHDHGITCVPRPVDGGFAPDGREMLAFMHGEPAPVCWSGEAAFAVGVMLRQIHDAAADYPIDGNWMPWWGRTMPSKQMVIGHCDAAPWNFLASDGKPVALLDWDSAGPVGCEWDLAQAAWLNAQLHDDDIAERLHLPDAAARGQLVSALCDGYGAAQGTRQELVERMIEVAVRTAAQEAIDGGVTPDGTAPTPQGLLGGGPALTGHDLLWAVTWRARSARWMLDNRRLLERHVGAR